MTDVFSRKVRSKVMRAVPSENTTPELTLRRYLHRRGYRYRLHQKNRPGKPDLVFPGRRKIIFVHGCFWHGHTCPRGNRIPKTNREYWVKKINRNVIRHLSTVKKLRSEGWSVATVWECRLHKSQAKTFARITAFLDPSQPK